MVVIGGVLVDGAAIVVGKERVDFVIVVLGVYNYCSLALISFGDHGLVVGDFVVNLFHDVPLSFVFSVLVFSVVYCCNFLVAIMRKGFCSLSSRSLMAHSITMTSFSQVAFAGFSMVYWSPRSGSFCSSSVKWMSVRLMVRGNDAGCCSSYTD